MSTFHDAYDHGTYELLLARLRPLPRRSRYYLEILERRNKPCTSNGRRVTGRQQTVVTVGRHRQQTAVTALSRRQ